LSYENLHLNRQICHRVYVASNAMIRLYRPTLDLLDLTYPQYLLMLGIWELEESSVYELQKITKIDPGSLSLILKKLELKKIITISKDKEDKRKKIVRLTKKGLELKDKAKDVPKTVFKKLKEFSMEEVKSFVSLIDKVNEQIS
jgi:MarR family transcriptional regulator, organic hydroperoxide resistance regulator